LIANRCIVLNKQGKILLLQRSSKDVFEPGKWELPGGKLEQGQDTTHALEREVLEEAGIMVVPFDSCCLYAK
jgi:8-oxo-dGTP diphosphatase